MEGFKDWTYVVELSNPQYQVGSTVHNVLEFVDLGLGKSDKERVSIINSR